MATPQAPYYEVASQKAISSALAVKETEIIEFLVAAFFYFDLVTLKVYWSLRMVVCLAFGDAVVHIIQDRNCPTVSAVPLYCKLSNSKLRLCEEEMDDREAKIGKCDSRSTDQSRASVALRDSFDLREQTKIVSFLKLNMESEYHDSEHNLIGGFQILQRKQFKRKRSPFYFLDRGWVVNSIRHF